MGARQPNLTTEEYKRILPPKKLDQWQTLIRRYLWTPPDSRNNVR
jgi:hypothetical protein